MYKFIITIFCSIFFAFSLQAQETIPDIAPETETNIADAALYEGMDTPDHEAAVEKLLKNIDDYLLPNDHPIKPALDRIFSSSRVLASIKAMKKAGFINPVERRRLIIIGVHPDLKGYLLKVFLDKANVDELDKFVKRIEGARHIQSTIDSFGYNHLMNVPKKWLYQLPDHPKAETGSKIHPKKYILVVEDMNIENDMKNRYLYKTSVRTDQLDALYDILTTCGLIDSTFVPNIPFTRDGYISFIDTEFWGKTTFIYFKIGNLAKYLGPSGQKYWKKICKERKGMNQN